MNKHGHPSQVAARSELMKSGFVQAFSSPGRPELWCKPGDRRARFSVGRDAQNVWHIAPYPEPSSCLPSELGALNKRDRVLGTEQVSEAELDWLR